LDELQGSSEEKLAQLDVVKDFQFGEDKISFGNAMEVEGIEDLDITRVTMDDESYFQVNVVETNQAFLVKDEDDDSSTEGLSEEDFIF
jgi:hypothetical protein